jgi:hypothetical protein
MRVSKFQFVFSLVGQVLAILSEPKKSCSCKIDAFVALSAVTLLVRIADVSQSIEERTKIRRKVKKLSLVPVGFLGSGVNITVEL